jgi:hypothetical protein
LGSHHVNPYRTPAAWRVRWSVVKNSLTSAYGTTLERPAKLPADCICAARANPVQAASAQAPPTLMRRTPSAAMSVTLKPLSWTTRTLIGFGATALTTAAMFAGAAAPVRRACPHPPPRMPEGVGSTREADRRGRRGSTPPWRSGERRHATDRWLDAWRAHVRLRAAGRRAATPERPWHPRSTGLRRRLRCTRPCHRRRPAASSRSPTQSPQ